MKLEHITFQRWDAKHKKPFSQLYKDKFGVGVEDDSRWAPVVTAMAELLRRLETEVEAPPCWAFISHFTVTFYRRDVAVYGQGQPNDFLFDVNVSYGYAVPDGSCWNVSAFVIRDFNNKRHQLATVDEAIQTIIMILRHAQIFGAMQNGESGVR